MTAPQLTPEQAFPEDGAGRRMAEAILQGDETRLARLMAAFDVNEAAANGMTPLIYAMIIRRTALVTLLVQQGADPLRVTPGLGSPADIAARSDDSALLDALFAAGLAASAPDSSGGTLLHAAVRARRQATIVRLLDAGAAIDARDSAGHTPLWVAAAIMAYDIALLLLERGAQPDKATPKFLETLMRPQFRPGSPPDAARSAVLRALQAGGGETTP